MGAVGGLMPMQADTCSVAHLLLFRRNKQLALPLQMGLALCATPARQLSLPLLASLITVAAGWLGRMSLRSDSPSTATGRHKEAQGVP